MSTKYPKHLMLKANSIKNH